MLGVAFGLAVSAKISVLSFLLGRRALAFLLRCSGREAMAAGQERCCDLARPSGAARSCTLRVGHGCGDCPGRRVRAAQCWLACEPRRCRAW